MEAPQEASRKPVTLRSDLFDRVGMLCTYAEMADHPRTVDNFVDSAVEAYLTGFTETLAQDP